MSTTCNDELVLDPADARELAELGREVAASTERRNAAIRRIRAKGSGVREIARAVGLNHTTVLNILSPKQRKRSS
jgi:hypothetical protein